MRPSIYFYGKKAKVPLSDGKSNMEFYEPDSLLSEQISPKQMLPMELAIRETAWSFDSK